MPDIKLSADSLGNSDVSFLPGDIRTDSGLETAVYISLFTDAYDSGSDDGGYWGDALDDSVGSLLWTLRREKMTSDLPDRVKACCKDALQWMIENKIASEVNVSVEKADMYTLSIGIEITRPDSGEINIKYAYDWQAQSIQGVS